MACSQAKSLAIIGNFCELTGKLTGIWGADQKVDTLIISGGT